MTVRTVEVVGREEELGVVFGFLEDVGRFPAALLLEGEAGIGKTTLWQAGIAAAGDSSFRVLAARHAERERVLSFTVLGDLLAECRSGNHAKGKQVRIGRASSVAAVHIHNPGFGKGAS